MTTFSIPFLSSHSVGSKIVAETGAFRLLSDFKNQFERLLRKSICRFHRHMSLNNLDMIRNPRLVMSEYLDILPIAAVLASHAT